MSQRVRRSVAAIQIAVVVLAWHAVPPSARPTVAIVGRRLARSLGGRHAGHRDDQTQPMMMNSAHTPGNDLMLRIRGLLNLRVRTAVGGNGWLILQGCEASSTLARLRSIGCEMIRRQLINKFARRDRSAAVVRFAAIELHLRSWKSLSYSLDSSAVLCARDRNPRTLSSKPSVQFRRVPQELDHDARAASHSHDTVAGGRLHFRSCADA